MAIIDPWNVPIDIPTHDYAIRGRMIDSSLILSDYELMKIDPKTFENYWTPSKFFNPKQPTHYYSHFNARNDGECSIINTYTTRTKEYYDDINFVIKEDSEE